MDDEKECDSLFREFFTKNKVPLPRYIEEQHRVVISFALPINVFEDKDRSNLQEFLSDKGDTALGFIASAATDYVSFKVSGVKMRTGIGAGAIGAGAVVMVVGDSSIKTALGVGVGCGFVTAISSYSTTFGAVMGIGSMIGTSAEVGAINGIGAVIGCSIGLGIITRDYCTGTLLGIVGGAIGIGAGVITGVSIAFIASVMGVKKLYKETEYCKGNFERANQKAGEVRDCLIEKYPPITGWVPKLRIMDVKLEKDLDCPTPGAAGVVEYQGPKRSSSDYLTILKDICDGKRFTYSSKESYLEECANANKSAANPGSNCGFAIHSTNIFFKAFCHTYTYDCILGKVIDDINHQEWFCS